MYILHACPTGGGIGFNWNDHARFIRDELYIYLAICWPSQSVMSPIISLVQLWPVRS